MYVYIYIHILNICIYILKMSTTGISYIHKAMKEQEPLPPGPSIRHSWYQSSSHWHASYEKSWNEYLLFTLYIHMYFFYNSYVLETHMYIYIYVCVCACIHCLNQRVRALAGLHHDPKSKHWRCPILHFSCYVNPRIPSPEVITHAFPWITLYATLQ